MHLLNYNVLIIRDSDQEVKFQLSEAMRGVRDDCSYLGVNAISVVDDEIDSLCDTIFSDSFEHVYLPSITSTLHASSCECIDDMSCGYCVEIDDWHATSHDSVDFSAGNFDISCAHPTSSGLGKVSSTCDAGSTDYIGIGKQATSIASPMLASFLILGSGDLNAYGDAPIPPSPCDADAILPLAALELQELVPSHIQELEELRLQAYDEGIAYKDKLKRFHDKNILRKEFKEGDKVMMFKARLKILPGKFKTRWEGPYEVVKAYPYGAFELLDGATGSKFKVNGHLLKHFHEPSQPP